MGGARRHLRRSTRARGLIAASAGKIVQLFDQSGRMLKELTHPSTVTGLVFDGKGKRIGASHYNGASLWFVAAKTDTPRKLEWKGSHTGIVIHPEGEAVVTAMQENALHGWKLPDGAHMRMSGYPAKTTSLSFTRNGKWMASSGADAMVLWPFFGGGPMGKAPLELAGRRRHHLHAGCLQPEGGDRRGRVRRRAGGGGRYRLLAASCRSCRRSTGRSAPWPGARTARGWRSAPKPASPR